MLTTNPVIPQISVAQSAAAAAAAVQSMSYAPQGNQNLYSQIATNSGLKATPVRPSELLAPTWTPAPMPYVQNYEAKYTHPLHQSTAPTHPGLVTSNFYARSFHTPFYPMSIPLAEGSQFDYSTQGSSNMTLMGTSLSTSGSSDSSTLPAFDVKAYTFRKKSRLYVAVKHKNALRIEPIIYLKSCILDNQREVVRNWDYLRFSIHRFRDNALPKKKLSMEEMRTARILDVNISLVSPNNKNRLIEDSCPACVMRMDGERKIMQVLARNFKLTPAGDPVIDIRKGHAIVCIKLNCYCDHHNEQEGFVVRMQTEPEIVRMGGSVKLRICCEARSKTGPVEPDVEEEDGLTDIDAPVSTGSRSPTANERSIQSPSLSYKSESPDPRTRPRQPSIISSSIASPRSLDERVVSSQAVEPTHNGHSVPAPAFRRIYPLTPSEGTCLGGTRVTIHGANFDMMQNPVVYFGKVPAELVTISHHDVMECTTPPAENLKPGIVPVKIATLAFPLGTDNDSVDFMYMAPLDYDFYNLAATSLSYAMANEYPNDNSLAFILNAHGSGLGGLDQGLVHGGTDTLSGDTLDMGFAWGAKEDIVLDFLQAIQTLAPGRVLPAFQSETGQHTLLHFAAQSSLLRLAKELLAMGIDHTAVDRNRKTALHFAEVVGDAEMVRLLSSARVPPRPMVPRLDSSASQPSMRETVTALIQKHEATLWQALTQEQDRKTKELEELHNRSLNVLDLRDQHVHALASSEDVDGDEIAHFSGESSPSIKSEGEGSIGTMESLPDYCSDRKRKSGDVSVDPSTFKRFVKISEQNADYPTQTAHIQEGVTNWKRNVSLPGSQDLQIWACESVTVTSTSSTEPLLSSEDSTLTLLALSSSGLHLYMEKSPRPDRNTKILEHWSLLEIENPGCMKADSKDKLCLNMCGLVVRSGRDLSGEQLQVESRAVPEMLKEIEDALARLNGYQRLQMQGTWMKSRLDMWRTLFSVDDREFQTVNEDQLELRGTTLILKASLQDGQRGHSLAMMSAILHMVRDLDSCSSISFEGAKVAESGWAKPELIKELQKTVQAMKHVARWKFESCEWTSKTVQGFVNGLKPDSTAGDIMEDEERHQCKEISLAGNDFGEEDIIDFLTKCAETLGDLESLDFTGCNVGLGGMEYLVHHVSGLHELRLRGNCADKRWWQWMDVVLARNPLIQRCSLGARISIPESDKALLSLERLESLQNLTELDLSSSPITEMTLEVLEKCVRSRCLRTLALSDCQLTWSKLVPLFKAMCDVNGWTKSTLIVGSNPLFNTDVAIQDWENSVREAHVQVPFGIQMADLLLPDSTLQRILAPLEHATCFNELNFKGLYIKRARQEIELDSLPYDDARNKAILEGASVESCQTLKRILTSNSSLIMLDVSGKLDNRNDLDDSGSRHSGSRPAGGFGQHIVHAFPALAENKTLRVLSIDYNRFGEASMLEFCHAIRHNRSIGILSCDGNDAFTPKGLQAIE
ncbi:SPT3 Dosage dependent suppressor of Ty-induced promoter mutations-like protein, partial [Modicella reniformis]